MFNTLGRFKGLNDEMGFIVLHSLAEYPAWQAEAALAATAQQLVHVATGEGTNGWIPPYLRHHRALYPGAAQADARGAPAALAISISPRSTASTFRSRWPRCAGGGRMFGIAVCGAGRSTISRCSPATVTLALLGNAFVCGVISGPHDRYGARHGVGRDLRGADRGGRGISPATTRRDELSLRRDRKSSTPAL